MPSIFIFKTDRPLPPNCSTIRYYHGIDWCLQENEELSSTYQYIAQDAFPEYIVYTVQSMPSDWVGEDVLEIVTLPYQVLYDSKGIRIQQLGSWLQCIYESDTIPREDRWSQIQTLLSNPLPTVAPMIKEQTICHDTEYRKRQTESHRGKGQGRGGHGNRGGYRGTWNPNRAITTI